MKKPVIVWFNRFLKIITVFSTIIFIFMNLENMMHYAAIGDSYDATKSLHARFYYWLQEVYGEDEGIAKWYEIRDYTVMIINKGVVSILFVLIVIMMRLSLAVDKRVNNKVNKRLKLYYIVCFILMLFITFIAAPEYVDSIFDS